MKKVPPSLSCPSGPCIFSLKPSAVLLYRPSIFSLNILILVALSSAAAGALVLVLALISQAGEGDDELGESQGKDHGTYFGDDPNRTSVLAHPDIFVRVDTEDRDVEHQSGCGGPHHHQLQDRQHQGQQERHCCLLSLSFSRVCCRCVEMAMRIRL
ncbi:hypothetical protein F5B20DRAFT_287406 [Whalleya microplaca]|nr:hypothetical protein F5B20DRAFT_287406 [Whalleya microplaca]